MKIFLFNLIVFGGLYNQVKGETSVTVNDVTKPVTLTCPLNLPGDIVWSHNGSDISNSSKYDINDINKSLTIQSITSENDLGSYICKFMDYQETVYLKSQPVMSKSQKKSLNLIAGDDLALECSGYSYPSPSDGSWVKGDSDLPENDQRIDSNFITTGLWGNEKLKISDLRTEDQGDYVCRILNEVGQGNVTIRVRINSKLAPLWPIIGIMIEILLVIIIIVVLERKKSKVENKES